MNPHTHKTWDPRIAVPQPLEPHVERALAGARVHMDRFEITRRVAAVSTLDEHIECLQTADAAYRERVRI